MRRIAGALAALWACWLLSPDAPGQESSGGIIYSRHRHFRIPFSAAPGQKLKQLNLYVSSDQGKSWQMATSTAPTQTHFEFNADRDGFFWFAVQAIDGDGKASPPSMDNAQPNLKVVIDTQPPAIRLQALPSRLGEVGVSWDIRDDNLDLTLPDSLRLEYRGAGGQWLMLPVQPGANQYYWNPPGGGAVEVRLRARDRAGNWGEAATSVGLAGNPPPNPGNLGPGPITPFA